MTGRLVYRTLADIPEPMPKPCPRCGHAPVWHGQTTPEGTPCLTCPGGSCTPVVLIQGGRT